MWPVGVIPWIVTGRTPHGVRGLKFTETPNEGQKIESHPARGAWIEIKSVMLKNLLAVVAPRTGCVD